jgi:peptidoglycan-associated lipoprotein
MIHHGPRSLATFALLAAGALATQACATKGYVKKKIAENSVTTQASITASRDSAVMMANQQQMTANTELESRVNARMDSLVTALRADLATLKQEFNVRVTVMEDSIKMAVPVHFAFDDTTVRETDKGAIAGFAHIVRHYYPDANITIEGFADPAGSASYNRKLSQGRADAVKATLVGMGLDAMRLKTVGYGETRLVSRASRDDAGAELNRRVVFAIETVGSPITTTALITQR